VIFAAYENSNDGVIVQDAVLGVTICRMLSLPCHVISAQEGMERRNVLPLR